jgi:hemoglobin-like flavoprotein
MSEAPYSALIVAMFLEQLCPVFKQILKKHSLFGVQDEDGTAVSQKLLPQLAETRASSSDTARKMGIF